MNKKLIAKKLRELRGEKSREEVALANDISISALQMYENGQRVPKDPIKIKLADYYGTTVQEIFFENQLHETCKTVLNQKSTA